MKHYIRELKKWLTEEEHQAHLAKKKTCKGGREHDWVRVLPWGVEATEDYKYDVEPMYAAEKAIADFTERTYTELEKTHCIRCKYGSGFSRQGRRHEACSVCMKERIVNV